MKKKLLTILVVFVLAAVLVAAAACDDSGMIRKNEERNMTQKQLAELTGIKASVLSETINGKRNVSLSVAMALEKALEIPADIWMNLQTQYDLDSIN